MADKTSSEGENSHNVLQSNEEIVDEVLKGLGDTLILNDGASGEKRQGPHLDELPPEASVASDRNLPKSEENREEVPGSEIDEDDLIDEVALKDVEDGLSDLQKEQRRSEAEKCKIQGNDNFKEGLYRESVQNYTLGLRTCPLAYPKDRAILYSNRAAAKMKMERKESAIEDCSKAIELDPSYLKVRLRRATLYEETEKLDEALADYQEVLKLDPLNRDAMYASKRLPQQINERNEKMKTEMISKLKDLGNMILRPFNLSTDNFQVNQDPNSGGYSINFKPGPP